MPANLLAHFQAFLSNPDYNKGRSLSQVSVKNYVSDVRRFLSWLPTTPNIIDQITDANLQSYILDLQSKAPRSTITRHLSSLRRFFTFLELTYQISPINISPEQNTLGESSSATSGVEAGQKILADFKADLLATGFSKVTIKNYLSDAHLFLTYFPSLNHLTPLSIDTYKTTLHSLALSPATITRHLSSLRRFCRFAQQNGHLSTNPFTPTQPELVYRPSTISHKLLAIRQRPAFKLLAFANLTLLLAGLAFAYFRFWSPLSWRQRQLLSFVKNEQLQVTPQGFLKLPSDTLAIISPNLKEESVTRSKVAGVATTGGSDVTFGGALDENFNLRVRGVLEGSQLISTTTTQPPLVVASSQLVTNLNADLLDGYHADTDTNESEIPVVNASGQLTLSSTTPSIVADNSLAITAPGVTLSTTFGSDGDINLSPAGQGNVNVLTSNTADASLLVNNAQLSSGTLIDGRVGNANTGFNFLRFQGGSGLSTRFSVNSAGSVFFAGTLSDSYATNIPLADAANTTLPSGKTSILDALADAATGSNFFTDGGTYLYPTNRESLRVYDSGGTDYIDIAHDGTDAKITTANTGNIRLEDSVLITGNLTFNGGTIVDTSDEVDVDDSLAISANLLLTTTTGTTTFGGLAYTWPTTQTANYVLSTNGSGTLSWIANSGASVWTQASGVIYPTTTTDDLAIGGTSSTAPFFVNDSGTITFTSDTNLYRSAANTLTTDDNFTLAGTTGLTLSGSGADLAFTGGGTNTISSTGTLEIAAHTLTGNLTIAQDIDILLAGTTGTNDLGTLAIPFDNIYAVAFTQNGNTVCDTSGNCPSSVQNFWVLNSGALYPVNSTVDLLVGGTTTASAEFAFINVNSGTPTASISAIASGNSLYLTATGTIATTNAQSLRLGDSASTGNIEFFSAANYIDASGNLVISGNTTLGNAITDSLTFTARVAQDSDLIPITVTGTNDLGASALPWDNLYVDNIYSTGTFGGFWQRNLGVLAPANITDDLAVGGTATSSAKFQIFADTGSATTSGNLTFTGTAPTIATRLFRPLTLGDTQTGDILLTPGTDKNVGIGDTTPDYALDVTGDINASSALRITDEIALNRSGTVLQIGAGSNLTGQTFFTNGTVKMTLTSGGNFGIGDANPAALLTVGNGELFTVDSSGNMTVSGTSNLNGATTIGDAITDNLTFTARVAQDSDLIPITTTGTNDLGAALLPWDNLYVNNIITGSSGTIGFWQRNDGVLAPSNITDDLSIGGIATASAKFQVFGDTGNATTSGNLTFTGTAPTIATRLFRQLTIGDSQTGDILLSPGTAKQVRFFSASNYLDSSGNLVLSGNLTAVIGTFSGNIAANGGTITSTGALAVTPTTTLTLNSTGDLTLDSSTDINLDADGGDLLFKDGGTTIATFTNSTTDLLLTIAGQDLIFTNDNVFNVGGSGSDVSYNVIGDSTTGASALMNSDDDLYIEGNLEVDGSIAGNINPGFTQGSVIFADSTGALAQDNAAFFWDDTSNLLGLGTALPSAKLHVSGAVTGKALVVFDETGNQNILDASASGVPVFSITRTGALVFEGSTNDAFETTLTPTDPTADQIITIPNDTGTICISTGTGCPTGGTAGPWTEAANVVYLDTITNDVNIGGSTSLGKLAIQGDADEIQLLVQAHSTQTSSKLAVFETEAGSDVFSISGTGLLTLANLETIDNATTDDIIAFSGAGGADNTDLYLNLDGTYPILYSNTDAAVGLDDDLTFVGAQTISTTTGNLTIDTGGSLVIADTTVQFSAGSSTIDVLSASADTSLTISNSDGTYRANLVVEGQVRLGNYAADPTVAAGAGSLYYNTATAKVYYFNGATWVEVGAGAGSGSKWTEANGALFPNNTTVDVLIGGTSTAAADFAFMNVNSGVPTASIAGDITLAYQTPGTPTIRTTAAQDLMLAASGTKVVVQPDLQVNGGDILGASSETRITLVDALDLTSITGKLAVESGGASDARVQIHGGVTGKAAVIISETGDQDILAASTSAGTQFRLTNNGTFWTNTGLFSSNVADGASAVAYTFNTANTLTTAGAKVFSIQNASTEYMYVDKDGNLWAKGNIYTDKGFGLTMKNIGSALSQYDLVVINTTENNTDGVPRMSGTDSAYAKLGFGVVQEACAYAASCKVVIQGESLINVADSTNRGDYLFTSATYGQATSATKQYDGLVGVATSTDDTAPYQVQSVLLHQPAVSKLRVADKNRMHNDYHEAAVDYDLATSETNYYQVDENIRKGLFFDTFKDGTKLGTDLTVAVDNLRADSTSDILDLRSDISQTGRAGLAGGVTMNATNTDTSGSTYLGGADANAVYFYDRSGGKSGSNIADSTAQIQVDLGQDPNWYNGVVLDSSPSANLTYTPPANLSTYYNGALIKATGRYATSEEDGPVIITIQSDNEATAAAHPSVTFNWRTNGYSGTANHSGTNVTANKGAAYTLETGTNDITITFTDAYYYAGDIFKIASWYLEPETANDRGEKQAFPARAYIVAGGSNVDILDADTNKLWMRFSQGTDFLLGTDANNDPASVHLLNGKLSVATNGSAPFGLFIIDFAADSATRYNTTAAFRYTDYLQSRNTDPGNAYHNDYSNTSLTIIDSAVNDVHSTVITEGTLSKQFYAVATDTGLSVIDLYRPLVSDYSDVTNDDYNNVWLDSRGDLWGLNETQVQLEKWFDTHIYAQDFTNSTPNKTYDDTTTNTPAIANATATINASAPDSLYITEKTSTEDMGKSDTVYVTTNQGLAVIQDENTWFGAANSMWGNTPGGNVPGQYGACLEGSSTGSNQFTRAPRIMTPGGLVGTTFYNTTDSTQATIIANDATCIWTDTNIFSTTPTGDTSRIGSEAKGSVKYYTKDYISETLASDVRGMWPLNAANTSSDLEDVSIRANVLTATNITSADSVSGVRTDATDFDGSSEYLSCTDATCGGTSDLEPSATNFSFGAWIKTTDTEGAIMGKWNLNVGGSYVLGIGNISNIANCNSTTNGALDFCQSDGVTNRGLSGRTPVNDNNWHFVVVRSSTTRYELYVDGRLDASTTTVNTTVSNNAVDFMIGAMMTSSVVSDYFAGYIDEPWFTAETLTAPQIQRLYETGRRALQSHAINDFKNNLDENGTGTGTVTNPGNSTLAVGVQSVTMGDNRITTDGYAFVALNNTGSADDGYINKIDLNSDTVVQWVQTGTDPALADNDATALSVSPSGLEVVGYDAVGASNPGLTAQGNDASGTLYSKTITLPDNISSAYYWHNEWVDSDCGTSCSVTVSASNDGGTTYTSAVLLNTDSNQALPEKEYFFSFPTAGNSLKLKIDFARDSSFDANVYLEKYGIAWFNDDDIIGGGGGGLFTGSNSSVANGSYVEVKHNQNTNDLLANGWFYDASSSAWITPDEDQGVNHDATDIQLKGWWKMEEASGDIADTSRWNKTLIDKGTLTYQQTGKIEAGYGINFDGSTGYFCTGSGTTCADDNDFDFTGDFTIGAWVKHDGGLSGTDVILSKYTTTDGVFQLYQQTNEIGFTVFQNNSASAYLIAQTTVSSATDNSWHFIVGQVKGTTASLYVDGRLMVTDDSVTGSRDTNSAAAFIVGSRADSPTTLAYDGTLDDVFTYSDALTAEEIKALYDFGAKRYKVVQVDANTVRLYNYSGSTQNLRLDVSTGAGSGSGEGDVSLAPATADVDSGTSTNSIWINKTEESGRLLRLQNDAVDRFTVGWDGHATVSGSLTIGQASLRLSDTATGSLIQSTSNNLKLQVGGSTTGAAGNSSILFLDSSGSTRGRLDTATSLTGDGTDGAVTIANATKNINTQDLGADSDDNGTYADGIAYRVNAPSEGAISVTRYSGSDTLSNGLSAGDEVLLISLQGASGDTTDVGNYEFLQVGSVSNSTVSFGSPITKSFDGTTPANQKVVIQRIPQYTSVTLDGTDSITASAWDGLATTPTGNAGYLTGIVAFRANGTVSVGSGTSITANSLGARGGTAQGSPTQYAQPGESRPGTGTAGASGFNANDGGGGGGYDNNNDAKIGSGAGGGYGASGSNGTVTGAPSTAVGGSSYGAAALTQIMHGSGGGMGGCNSTCAGAGGAGGRGGGIVFVSADTITVTSTGSITANGANGSAGAGSPQGAGGGGGGGGSVFLTGNSLTLGTTLITSTAGSGGSGSLTGGAGGVGRIRVEYITALSGTTSPSASSEQITAGYGTLYIGSTNTASADVAEHYPSVEALAPGDVVVFDPERKLHIKRATSTYDPALIGIVSTDPGIILGQGDSHLTSATAGSVPLGYENLDPTSTYPVALVGRVPVKIDPASAPIAIGDYLTSSSVPGLAMKATQAGPVIARALESWSCSGSDPELCSPTLTAFVKLGYYDPSWQNASVPTEALAQEDATSSATPLMALNQQGNLVKLGSLALLPDPLTSATAGSVPLGYENLDLTSGESLLSPLASTDSAQIATDSATPVIPSVVEESLLTLKSLGTLAMNTVNTYSANVFGLLKANRIQTNELISPLVQTDLLLADSASISGTLTASSIESPTIASLSSEILDLTSDISGLEEATAAAQAFVANLFTDQQERESYLRSTIDDLRSSITSATASALLYESSEILDLTSFTYLDVSSIQAETGVFSDFLVQNTLSVNTISSLDPGCSLTPENLDLTSTECSSTLYLQASGTGYINLLAGLMTLDSSGQVVINGDLTVTGRLAANNATFSTLNLRSDNLDLTSTPASPSGFGKLLAIYDEEGREVGSVDTSGAARFNEVTAASAMIQQLIIAAPFEASAAGEVGPSSASTSSNTSIGTALLPAGSTEVTISSRLLTDSSLIYLTPISDTANQVLYVKTKDVCLTSENLELTSGNCVSSFTVAINSAINHDIQFNYWLIKTQ